MDAERIARRLSLRDLRIVAAVGRAGSMSKAASALAVSQPVVSEAITALEQLLGVPLFDRGRRGVQPTAFGNALIQCGTTVFDDVRRGIEQLEFLRDPSAGELRVGCTEPLASGFVATVVDRLSRLYPRALFHIASGDSRTLRARELPQRNIEVAVALGLAATDQDEVSAEFLFDDRFVLVVDARSPWARRRRVRLAELIREPWVLPPAGAIDIGAAFRANNLEPPRPHVLSFSIPLHQFLLSTGRFITMLPLSVLHFSRHLPVKQLRVELPPIPRPVALLTLKDRSLSPLAQHFIETARDVAGQVIRNGPY